VRSSVLSLISSAPAKNDLSHYASTAQLLSVVRQYIETSQQCKMETTKIVSSMRLYSQLGKRVSRLAASAINDDRSCRSGREQEIEDGLAASKALNESCPRRLRRPLHLMCLVLPFDFSLDWATSNTTCNACSAFNAYGITGTA